MGYLGQTITTIFQRRDDAYYSQNMGDEDKEQKVCDVYERKYQKNLEIGYICK